MITETGKRHAVQTAICGVCALHRQRRSQGARRFQDPAIHAVGKDKQLANLSPTRMSGASGLPPDVWEQRFKMGTTPWERDGLNPGYSRWRDTGELQPCRILVPGAGRSHEPAVMLADGFDVLTLDLAETAVAVQRERLGAERASLGDVTTWQAPTAFDAVYDQTCLCALPPSLWIAYEASLRRWLRPGGRLFILFMQAARPGGPPFDCPIPMMHDLFRAWTWPDAFPEPIAHWSGFNEQPAVLTLPA